MKKVILLIDDQRNFVVARQSPVQIARNSADGIELLATFLQDERKIDELWLDHDLGPYDTISKVIDYLIENREGFDIHRIYVHTMNPVGADMMMRTLHRAKYTVYRVAVKGLLKNVTT